jgi:hypothetical protein
LQNIVTQVEQMLRCGDTHEDLILTAECTVRRIRRWFWRSL